MFDSAHAQQQCAFLGKWTCPSILIGIAADRSDCKGTITAKPGAYFLTIVTRVACSGKRSLDWSAAFFTVSVIQMLWREHGPPHFHALYAEHEARIDLVELRVIRGSLPRRALALVLEWSDEHRDELMEDSKLCGQMQPLKEIEPLK